MYVCDLGATGNYLFRLLVFTGRTLEYAHFGSLVGYVQVQVPNQERKQVKGHCGTRTASEGGSACGGKGTP